MRGKIFTNPLLTQLSQIRQARLKMVCATEQETGNTVQGLLIAVSFDGGYGLVARYEQSSVYVDLEGIVVLTTLIQSAEEAEFYNQISAVILNADIALIEAVNAAKEAYRTVKV